ncbi:MAG: hypothetical protein ABL984_12465 [Pyrinomonadaceae bacterium]
MRKTNCLNPDPKPSPSNRCLIEQMFASRMRGRLFIAIGFSVEYKLNDTFMRSRT